MRHRHDMTGTRPAVSRRGVALGVAVVGTTALGLWMANRRPVSFGPLWGTLIALLASAAWAAWLVPRGDTPGISWRQTPLGRCNGERITPVVSLVLSVLVLGGGAVLGGADALSVTILAALACWLPPALRRPGLGAMVLVAAIYLPHFGATSLWDPWEPHYGEVAREILARNDWISLWWAQDKWFWSKPVLLFWMEALSMGALGVDFVADANPAHPEWAVRLPTIALSFAALASIYATVRRTFGVRAAALATLVTATMPQFFFLSHQATTDMPLVAMITIACCCLLLALCEDPIREAPALRVGRWTISLQHVVAFALIVVVLPQAVYLISRNLSWIEGSGLVAHPDRFLYGSAGNAEVPGNPSPRDQLPAVRGLLGQPFLQGVVWLGVLAFIGAAVRRERRAQALYMVAFYLFCGLGFLAKGLPGLVIPGGAALFYLLASRRWALLAEGQLHVSFGLLIVTAVGMPWYVAMYVRHGGGFINRLLIHDHINRLAAGVHGDTGSIGYFLRELGYASFPWIALLPLALVTAFVLYASEPRSNRAQVCLFLGVWLLSSFALFSAMVTKFHHYLLPTLVPASILVGIALGKSWGPPRPAGTVLAALFGASLALGIACLAGDPRGIVPPGAMAVQDWVLTQRHPTLAALMLISSLLFGIFAHRQLGAGTTRLRPSSERASTAVAMLLGACAVVFVGRDLSWMTSARPQGNERLIHLFVYNYTRAWPDHLDYRAILTGFAVAVGGLVVLASVTRWRPLASRALAGVAIAFCAWGLNVYMTDLAGHWGFRALAARYYAERGSDDEPLIAWQMNWKGENFYTGNRVYVFAETDNERFKRWIAKNEGQRVYVVLEHKRLERLKKLFSGRGIERLTTRREHNKYLLVTLEI